MEDKTDKIKQAIALEYDPSEDAPKVIASGRGILKRLLRRQRKAMFPFIGMINWRIHYHDWKSGI